MKKGYNSPVLNHIYSETAYMRNSVPETQNKLC